MNLRFDKLLILSFIAAFFVFLAIEGYAKWVLAGGGAFLITQALGQVKYLGAVKVFASVVGFGIALYLIFFEGLGALSLEKYLHAWLVTISMLAIFDIFWSEVVL